MKQYNIPINKFIKRRKQWHVQNKIIKISLKK